MRIKLAMLVFTFLGALFLLSTYKMLLTVNVRSVSAPEVRVLPVIHCSDLLQTNVNYSSNTSFLIPTGPRSFSYERYDLFDDLLQTPPDEDAMIKHDKCVVPNIVHFCLFNYGGKRFTFDILISVLSAKKIQKAEKIYFWHNGIPTGPYWKELLRAVPELILVYRQPPRTIFGKKVANVEHQSDIARYEALLEFGGIYMDMDVIIVKPLDIFRKYDFTMGYETKGLNNGLIISKPWSDFLKIWYHRYKSYNSVYVQFSVILPAILARNYSNLIHTVEESLQYPTYSMSERMINEGRNWDWRSRNYAVHTYFNRKLRNIKSAVSPKYIKKWQTTIGEIFRYIYYGEPNFTN